jgi:glycosyltransferase involved in cell wall biosynthesis
MKIAILHDWFDKRGGGERLVINLARALKADVYTGFVNPDKTFDTKGVNIISLGVSERWPQPLRGLRMAEAFSKYDFPEYDAYLFSGVWCISAVRKKSVLYCHAPPRYMYDLRDYYMRKAGIIKKLVMKWLIRKWKPMDQFYMKQFDVICPNSENVKNRINKYYGAGIANRCTVVYTGIDTKSFRHERSGDFYLSSQRLDGLKRIDLIISAFSEMPQRHLVIAGTGPEEKKLKNLAKGCDNIMFAGSVSDREIRKLYASCRAVIVAAKDEDLGLAAIEAQASGKPTIAVAEGGLLETIDNESGVFFQPSIGALKKAVETLEKKKWNPNLMQKRAKKYDISVFSKKMKKILADVSKKK